MKSEIDIQISKAIVNKEMKLKKEYLSLVRDYGRSVKDNFQNENGKISVLQDSLSEFREFIENMKGMFQPYEYVSQKEVFETFYDMCGVCRDLNTLNNNIELFLSMMELFCQSVETLYNKCKNNKCRCICCETGVQYSTVRDWESFDVEEDLCPVCESTMGDRMIVSFLQKAGLNEASEDTKVLQIAPESAIKLWIETYAPHVNYETMDMHMIKDETYDLVLCSHVVEEENIRNTICELRRLIKPNGLVVFPATVLIDVEEMNEGQEGDIYVLGKEYFGQEIFEQNALADARILYVLTKDKDVELDLSDKYKVDEELLTNGPLVSVVLLTYNHEDFVADAIECILNQTYQNMELLVADDGSTDNTAEVVKRYSKYLAKEYYFEENIGDRTSILLDQATGKYIAVAHSDDFWEPDKLALQVDYLERHEDVDACFTWGSEIDEDKNALDTKVFIQKNRTSCEWMKFFWNHGNALCHPSLVIKKEEYIQCAKVGHACRQLPDFFMWVDLIQYANIYVMPKVLVKMTRFTSKSENENTSSNTQKNRLRSTIEAAGMWSAVIRKMEKSFFIEAFHDLMRNPNASEDAEIVCEKFFLMLGHETEIMQANAIQYFFENFDVEIISECFACKYSFTAKDFWEIMVEKGYAAGKLH